MAEDKEKDSIRETLNNHAKILMDINVLLKDNNVRFQHLESIGTPQWYEQGLEECKDVVTKLQNDLEVLKNQVKTWMESFQTETILLFEAQHWMKVSGCTHQELCDVLHADVSTISRILNGKKVREYKNDFAKIKAYCIQKMAKEMKMEPKEDKERESYINNTNVGNV